MDSQFTDAQFMDAELREEASAAWREQVGSRLRAERERRGWEIQDVADRLRLRASFVAAVEAGRGREQMDEAYEWSHIRAIAGMLGIELEASE